MGSLKKAVKEFGSLGDYRGADVRAKWAKDKLAKIEAKGNRRSIVAVIIIAALIIGVGAPLIMGAETRSKYNYVLEHFDASDDMTFKNLHALVSANYEDALSLSDELYGPGLRVYDVVIEQHGRDDYNTLQRIRVGLRLTGGLESDPLFVDVTLHGYITTKESSKTISTYVISADEYYAGSGSEGWFYINVFVPKDSDTWYSLDVEVSADGQTYRNLGLNDIKI